MREQLNGRELAPIKSNPADYAIALITNKSDELTQKFVKTQKFLGAAEFHICFDRNIPANTLKEDGVRTYYASDFYHEGKRPEKFTDLQRAFYNQIYSQVQAKWVAFVDFDEIIFHPRFALHSFLASLPADINIVKAASLETIWGASLGVTVPFSAAFYKEAPSERLPQRSLRLLFGRFVGLAKRKGFVGHTQGKCLVKSGLPIEIDIHQVRSTEQNFQINSLDHQLKLLHFDAPNFEIWWEKFGAGRGNPKGSKLDVRRTKIAESISAEKHDPKTLAIFEEIYVWNKKKRDVYAQFGHISRLSSDWGCLANFGNTHWLSKLRYSALKASGAIYVTIWKVRSKLHRIFKFLRRRIAKN